MFKSALLLTFAGIGWAAPIVTCSQQEKCFKTTFSKDPITTCSSGDCQWKVCLKLDYSDAACVKSDTISHTCVKSDTECQPAGWGQAKTEIGEGFEECQTGSPGKTLTFVLKDGNTAGKSTEFLRANNTLLGAPADAVITCAPSTGLSCTGKGNTGKERIWSVTLPSCEAIVPAPVTTPTTDTILVLDVSSSTNVEYTKQYAKERVKKMKLNEGNRVGIAVYPPPPFPTMQMVYSMGNDLQQVLSKIDAITYRAGSADLSQAIGFAGSSFSGTSANKRQVLEVVCTGKSSVSAKDAATTQKSKGITILAIGVGSAADTTDLSDVASSSDCWIKSDDATAVVTIAGSVVSNPPLIRRTDAAPPAVPTADTILLLDVSSSMGDGGVEDLKDYVRERISKMDLTSGNRGGIVVYSTQAKTEILCPLTSDVDTILLKVDQISVRSGVANLAEAIKVANSVFAATTTSTKSQVLEVVFGGATSSSTADVKNAISASRAKGVYSLAIGVGSTVDSTQLSAIASEPTTDTMIQVQDSTYLAAVADSVMGCCPPVIYAQPEDSGNCVSAESHIPKSLNVVDSSGVPACWFGDVKNMLSPYECQEVGNGCNLLQCNLALPDDVMAQLAACK